MLPDYGLDDDIDDEALSVDDGDEDTFNDDTFGDVSVGGWEQGGEAALEMSRLHEQFLSGDLSAAQAVPGMLGGQPDAAPLGAFFGDALGDAGNDFLLEDRSFLPRKEITRRGRSISM